jgi:hypothetical protein
MNLTISTTAINTWKRIKVQHITALCGLTLALSAAVAVGGWQTNERSNPVSSSSALSASPEIRTFEKQYVLYFITGSQLQAAAMQLQIAEETSGTPNPPSEWAVHFFVADTPEAEETTHRSIDVATNELMAHGLSVQVVDLRSR